MIKIKSNDNENNEGQFSRHFPAFIWVVRDFTLMLESDGKEITEEEYLENALLLEELEGTEENSKIQERNRSRDAIRMYFNTRKCFAFDLPSGDKNVLQKMDEEELTPSFMAQCQKFCEYIYKNAEVKHVDDIILVSGEILGQLVYKYTEAITSSTAMCMEDVVMSISEMKNRAAVREATEHYEKMMRERGQFPTETLEEFIELSAKFEEEALQMFTDKSFNDLELNFHAQFMRNIEERKKEFSKMNEVTSLNYCDHLIKKYSKSLEQALQQDLYSKPGGYQKFQEDMAMIEEKYNSEPRKGVEAESVLMEFIQSKEAVRSSIFMTTQALAEPQLKQEEDNRNTQLRKRENKLKERKLANNGVIVESKKRSVWMHLTALLNKKKTDNSKRQERLDRVIQSKSRERNICMSGGFTTYAATYDEQIGFLSREKLELKDPVVLERVATFFQEHAIDILCISLAVLLILVKIILLRSI